MTTTVEVEGKPLNINNVINEDAEETPISEYLSGFLEDYDIVRNGRKKTGNFKSFFATSYDVLFGIKNKVGTDERVAALTCWNTKNPFKSLSSFTTVRLHNSTSPEDFGTFNKDKHGSWYHGFGKSLFCTFFKIIPWAHPILFFFRYIWIFVSLILKFLQVVFAGIGNSLRNANPALNVASLGTLFLIGYLLQIFASLGPEGTFEGDYVFVKYKKNGIEIDDWRPDASEMVKKIIGLTTPIFLIIGDDEDIGKYGKGQFLFIILALMLISGILIFFGGATISVIVFAFGYYCFKLVGELSNFKLDSETAPNPSSSPSTPKPPGSSSPPKI